MPKYRVVPGWQIKHDDKRLQGGDTFTAQNNHLTKAWLANGWIEEAEDKRADPKKEEPKDEAPKTNLTAARAAPKPVSASPKTTQRR